MTRSTHLVGSWTARSAVMAMDNALERLAPHPQRLSDVAAASSTKKELSPHDRRTP
jgi:hypothetical protein